MRTIHFIINPEAGSGRQIDSLLAGITDLFQHERYHLRIHRTEYPGHAAEIAEIAAAELPDCIIACGGDGTVNEVASAIIGTDITFGIIPVGSGNGFAATLNIPMDVRQALLTIREGIVRRVDYGMINGRCFFNNAGLSFDAEAIRIYEQKKMKGLFGYAKACVYALFSYRPSFAMVEAGGHQYDILPFLLVISNSSQMGYNKSLSPNADPADGNLDLLMVPELKWHKKLYLGYLIWAGKISKFNKADILRSADFKIEFPEKIFTMGQVDGESRYFKTNEFVVCTVVAGLPVFVPRIPELGKASR
ncbi:diacylglycerol kinase family protein [uncultured Flavobacterium sp.]|uniref:diacylglycerol/lipid kinase family protein n=1 Tax=uncultured Flavobacterium sp. TaxID=165435 RepID=UPI0025D9067F|nr:diacylglycerol kinase family protein [uncultured Flavobacterium sp.]